MKSLFRIYLLVGIFLIFIGLPHQAWAYSTPLLYQAEKGGQVLYLLGTIHAGKEDFYPLPDAILRQLANSDRLVMEVEPEALAAPTTKHQMQRFYTQSPPRPLKTRMSKQLYTRVSAKLQALGIAEAHLLSLRNWAIVMQMIQAQFQQLDWYPWLGVDRYVTRQAFKRGIEIEALETIEFQLTVLSSQDELAPDFLFQNTLDELEQAEQYLAELETAWRTGDQQALIKLSNEYYVHEELHIFMQRMLKHRNQNWLAWIEQQPPELKLFFVIGDMHLHGPDSLLEMLKSAGYKVKAQPND